MRRLDPAVHLVHQCVGRGVDSELLAVYLQLDPLHLRLTAIDLQNQPNARHQEVTMYQSNAEAMPAAYPIRK